ncbi:hypothetical protein [Lentzea sp. NPDC059081]|uniref:hypothetical protein n=1 Tax=Lentzea sp. NPDC059081 TaxID=3346719 RepID=UPI003680C888
MTYHLMTWGASSAPGVKHQVDLFAPIDKFEYERVMDSNAQLMRFIEADLLPYVEYSYQQFMGLVKALDHAARFSAQTPQINAAFNLELSCNLLGFLSAVVMYYEQTTRVVKHRSESDSRASEQLRTLFVEAFDGALGYRFCFKFRQFVAHKSFNAVNFSINRQADVRASGIIVPRGGFVAEMDKAHLLSERDVWNKQLREEIEEMPDRIDLIAMMDEAMSAVREVGKKARKLVFPDISNTLFYMRELAARFDGRAGTPGVMRMPAIRSEDGRSEISPLFLDFNIIGMAEAILEESAVLGDSSEADT